MSVWFVRVDSVWFVRVNKDKVVEAFYYTDPRSEAIHMFESGKFVIPVSSCGNSEHFNKYKLIEFHELAKHFISSDEPVYVFSEESDRWYVGAIGNSNFIPKNTSGFPKVLPKELLGGTP